jgi:meso-butanediol dehydrogenase / (S,S)-butanediol dehydrogenase / diacetyl reductase
MRPSTSHGRFEQRTVLVVGGASGIGWATAQRIADEGGRVAVADLPSAGPEERAAELSGGGHLGLPIDVLDQESVDRALGLVSSRVSTLHAIAHVAGGDVEHGRFETIDDATWRLMFELNLLGPVRVLRAFIPLLKRKDAESPGSAFAVVSSINASLALGSEPYSAAKAGLSPLVANLAAQYGPVGLRFNALSPGTTRTRVWDDQGGPDHLSPAYPLERVGEPSDIAAALAFLCSDDSSFITGQTLAVDGGLSVQSPFRTLF